MTTYNYQWVAQDGDWILCDFDVAKRQASSGAWRGNGRKIND